MANLAARAAAWEIPLGLAAGLVSVESGGVANACGDRKDPDPRAVPCPHRGPGHFCSWGLLQLNRCGGQGAGWPVAQLINPDTNLDIGLPPIAAAWHDAGPNDTIWDIMQNSGHPGNARNDPELTAAWAPLVEVVECAIAELDGVTLEGELAGSIRSETGAPISGAVLELIQASRATVTDSRGEYRVRDLDPGIVTITVRATGFFSTERTVNVPPGGTAIADFVLTRSTPPPPPPPIAGQIAGFVRDHRGSALRGARVTSSPVGGVTITDSTGFYRFPSLPECAYAIDAEFGRRTAGLSAFVRAGATTNANLTIDLSTSPPPPANGAPGNAGATLVVVAAAAATAGLLSRR